MANDLVLPIFLQAMIGKQTSKDVAKFLPAAGVRSLPAHISIADNRFTLIEDDGEERQLQTTYMDAIVVAVSDRPSRIYYGADFVKGETYSPPKCFSDNGVGASSKAAEPQSANCTTCPQAVWGAAQSKMTGKPIPACSEGQKIVVMFEDKLYMLRLPPMSIKPWESYVRYLEKMLRDRGILLVPSNVITRIDFASQGVLKFEPVGFVTDEINAQIEGLDPGEIEELLGYGDQPWEESAKDRIAREAAAPPVQIKDHMREVGVEQFLSNFPQRENSSPERLRADIGRDTNSSMAPKRTRGPNKPKLSQEPGSGNGQSATGIEQSPFAPDPPSNKVASFLDRAMGRG